MKQKLSRNVLHICYLKNKHSNLCGCYLRKHYVLDLKFYVNTLLQFFNKTLM